MVVDDDFVRRLWKLANELSSHQQNNQDLVTEITARMRNMKAATTLDTSCIESIIQHSSQNYNPNHCQDDQLSDEEVKRRVEAILTQDSETRDNLAHKVVRTQADLESMKHRVGILQQENNHLQSLVDDYEHGLETVATKLRSYTYQSTHGQSQLRREYEALLDAEKSTTATLFRENTMLKSQLAHLSGTLREALKETTATDDGVATQMAQLMAENRGLRAMLTTEFSEKASDPGLFLGANDETDKS